MYYVVFHVFCLYLLYCTVTVGTDLKFDWRFKIADIKSNGIEKFYCSYHFSCLVFVLTID